MKDLKTLSIEFIKSKQAKRAGWTILNVIMGVVVSYIAYLAGAQVEWAVLILPFVTAICQLITKELNSKPADKPADNENQPA